jgi:hypothetical protein
MKYKKKFLGLRIRLEASFTRLINIQVIGCVRRQIKFNVHVSVHRESLSTMVQQNATIYSLLYFCKLLCIFWVVTSPIIKSTKTVITVSDTSQTSENPVCEVS